MKKKILSFALAFGFMFQAICLLSSCGASESAFGKTFTYDSAYINFENTYGNEEYSSISLEQYISNKIANIDWSATLGDTSFSETVRTVSRAKELLTQRANEIYLTRFRNLAITISNESEHKLTLGTEEFTFETKADGNLAVYDEERREIVLIKIDLAGGKLKSITPSFDIAEGSVSSLPESSFLINIILTGGVDSSITAYPLPLFKEVKA